MKKIITILISLLTIISMLSSTAVSAVEKMSDVQINNIMEDYLQKGEFLKDYTSGDWVYGQRLNEYHSDTEEDEDGEPKLIAIEVTHEIRRYKNSTATSVIIPNSIDGHKIYSVFHLTFKNSPNLDKVVLSNGIKFIDAYVFKNHKKLKQVVLPISMEFIGYGTFHNCKKLKTVTLPKNSYINKRAFKNCINLENLNYKGTVKHDEGKGILYNPSFISDEAFANCIKLKNINLGNEGIGKKAFYNCKSLKFVSLPKNTTYIGKKAFEQCKSLSKVTIKDTKKSPKLDKNAFKNTKKGIKFVVKNKRVAKQLKKQLKKSGVKNAKILIGKKVVYQNING